MKVISCLFALVAIAQSENSDCERPCLRVFRPVCGFDGTTKTTYMNDCELQNKICNNKNMVKIQDRDCNIESNSGSYVVSRTIEKSTGQDQNTNVFQDKTEGNYRVDPVRACFKPCPLNYAPICGSDGTTKRKFHNECHMGNDNCEKNKNFVKVNDGECEIESNSGSSVVSRTIEKSTGQDQNTNVFQDKTEGNYRVDPVRACFKPCPINYAPICGSDGTTKRKFHNECHMGNDNCEKNKNFVKVNDGECGEESVGLIQAAKVAVEKTATNVLDHVVDKVECPIFCPLIYAPFCGSDGTTERLFINECDMKRAICAEKKKFTKVNDGNCRGISNLGSSFGF